MRARSGRDHGRGSSASGGEQETAERRRLSQRSVRRYVEVRRRSGVGHPGSHDVCRVGAPLAGEAVEIRAELGDLMVFDDSAYSVGGTPLVKLNRVTGGAPVTILAKMESRNPLASVKDRIGASMIWDAEKRGILKPGKELIEPTSGNTGIALAFVAAARGYPITLLMPETMSLERRQVLKALGARLILTDGALGMGASIERAEQMVADDPERLVLLQQFRNPANPDIHRKTTGPEIWSDT